MLLHFLIVARFQLVLDQLGKCPDLADGLLEVVRGNASVHQDAERYRAKHPRRDTDDGERGL